MEKRSITGKDILRMDGLLPPTRRLPVCDAVTSSDKKKEKKWSIGGIFKLISSIRDYDSSSNEEEMVYCTRQSRPLSVFNQKSHNVTLHPVKRNTDHHLSKHSSSNGTIDNSVDTASLQRDSVHFRSSDGSLDRLNKKLRKSVLKARIEAERDRICAGSSSDEDSRVSCNSLNRFQNESSTHNTQKSSSCNKKTRAARTERYIKRLSKDEGHRFSEQLNNASNRRNSLDCMDAHQSLNINESNLLYPQVQSRSITQPNSYTFPVQRSVENVRQAASCSYQTKSSTELARYPSNRYITDLNQNNTYAKQNVLYKDKHSMNHEEQNYVPTSPALNSDYAKPYDYIKNNKSAHHSSSPPEPPPRDPRCKVFSYGYNSFPSSGKYKVSRYYESPHQKVDNMHEAARDHLKGTRSYDTNNEISWCGSNKQCPRRPLSLTVIPTQSCNLSECTNNKHNSTGRHVNKSKYQETEAMKCQRRNNRNEQLNSRFNDHNVQKREQKLTATSRQNIFNNSTPANNKALKSPDVKSSSEQTLQDHPNNSFLMSTKVQKKDDKQATATKEDVLDRRRSWKNLEEALSELETIYNSLCLGDEDLLDRAERRSMEEFTLRRGETDSCVALDLVDSPDRSKDDMAYRRMHPKEKPASLLDVIGQSALSNISYLMASPVLSRKDIADDYPYATNYQVRKDEPDVTRDDVVYRSIHHANNTLKVADPQPPFGIPLRPVTTATESDYLHTTPTKPNQPRSLYIPQCEPDIVTDDLAYRTLRKDANTAKNAAEGKTGVLKDQETTLGIKKKRAVRSLSANLYGLINHDRIHLRREPSLQELKMGISDTVIDVNSLPSKSDCFRRVVSDGELSDYDTRWRSEASLKTKRNDINGNHPISNISRRKLRVYVSPSTRVQNFDKKSENDTGTQNSVASNGILSQALSTDFWQDRLQTKSNDSSNLDTESDFTAYSNLCQDLVNLIEGEENAHVQPNAETLDVEAGQPTKIDELDDSRKADTTVLHIQTLGGQYSEHNDEDHKKIGDNEAIERLTESICDSKNEDVEKSDDNGFDFYLRVADENVKLIVEAFSSFADRLRDSRLSQKNSLTSRCSEIETDSTAPNTSTCSSITYSPEDENDDLSSLSKSTDVLNIVPKKNTSVSTDWDHEEVESEEVKNNSNIDSELDLSKAVHDLQLAAASLCEHEKEINELEALWKKDASDAPSMAQIAVTEEKSLTTSEKAGMVENDDRELKCDQEETVLSTDVKLPTDEHDPDDEGLVLSDIIEKYFVSPTLLRVVRVAKVGRVLRLVKGAKGIRTLLFALAMSLPALFNICLLLFLVMFIFAIFGMSFFMHVKDKSGLDDVYNFKTFGQSMILLFQMSTSAGWDGVLDGIINEEDCQEPNNEIGYPGNCGSSTIGIAYLLSYLVISFLIVINMYIAVILENYSQATEDVQEGLTDDDYDMYYEIWQQFDPDGTQYIRYDQLSDFLDVLEPPLQIHKPNKYKIVSMDIPICKGDLMFCVDVLDALTKDFFARKGNPIEETGDIEVQTRPGETGYEPVSSTLWRQREEYCARLIQNAWRKHKQQRLGGPSEESDDADTDPPVRQTAVHVESDGFVTTVVIHGRSPSVTSRTADV